MSGNGARKEILVLPQQNIDSNNILRRGETLQVKNGVTGWIEREAPPLIMGAPMTVELFRKGHTRAIEVTYKHRKHGVGSMLIDALADRLVEQGVGCLVIPEASVYASGFYNKALAALKARGKVENIEKEVQYHEDGDPKCVDYIVILR